MTDEEIKDYARGILLGACEETGFPDSVPKLESETGEIGFELDISSVFVKGYIVYSPQPYLEMLIKKMDAKTSTDPARRKFQREILHNFIGDVAILLMKMMTAELKSSANNLPYLANELLQTFFLDRNFLKKTEAQQNQQINKIIEEMNAERRKKILALAKECHRETSAPQYIFCDIYDSRLKLWKKAKSLYNSQKKKHKKPLEIVKAAYPDLPSHLIERFALEYTSYIASPGALAMQETIELLSVPPKKVKSSRQRDRYLEISREQRALISDEEVNNAELKYLDWLERISDTEDLFWQSVRDMSETISD